MLISAGKWRLGVGALLSLALMLIVATPVCAQSAADAKADDSLGFKVGQLRIHPGLSVADLYDTNVHSQSSSNGPNSVVADDILQIIGALKLNYPDPRFAFTLDGQASYQRYFGLDESGTKSLSSFSGQGRVALSAYRDGPYGGTLSDQVTRTVSPQQVGIESSTSDRIHNTADLRLHIKPGAGQLRFFLDYLNDLERYDASGDRSQNWIEHTGALEAELEFLPKTAVFLHGTFGFRDYYQWKAADNLPEDLHTVNTASPNAMPLRVTAGLMGRLTPLLSLNVAGGYGRLFSKHFEDFSNFIGKAEVSVDFTNRTALKVGFNRDFTAVTTYSYTVDNKLYTEFKQWMWRDIFKFSLVLSYDMIQYGAPDKGIILIADNLTPGDDNPTHLKGGRLDRELVLSPDLRIDILKWLFLDINYTLTWHDTGYKVSRLPENQTAVSTTYYDYLKHVCMFKLAVAY